MKYSTEIILQTERLLLASKKLATQVLCNLGVYPHQQRIVLEQLRVDPDGDGTEDYVDLIAFFGKSLGPEWNFPDGLQICVPVNVLNQASFLQGKWVYEYTNATAEMLNL